METEAKKKLTTNNSEIEIATTPKNASPSSWVSGFSQLGGGDGAPLASPIIISPLDFSTKRFPGGKDLTVGSSPDQKVSLTVKCGEGGEVDAGGPHEVLVAPTRHVILAHARHESAQTRKPPLTW